MSSLNLKVFYHVLSPVDNSRFKFHWLSYTYVFIVFSWVRIQTRPTQCIWLIFLHFFSMYSPPSLCFLFLLFICWSNRVMCALLFSSLCFAESVPRWWSTCFSGLCFLKLIFRSRRSNSFWWWRGEGIFHSYFMYSRNHIMQSFFSLVLVAIDPSLARAIISLSLQNSNTEFFIWVGRVLMRDFHQLLVYLKDGIVGEGQI